MKSKACIVFILLVFSASIYSQKDNTKYVDPTIGNVSRFLVPTYPTIQLPNQMVRMFPNKTDYISDVIKGFPLQDHDL